MLKGLCDDKSGWTEGRNARAQNNYVVPNMAAKAVTATPIKEANAWGQGEVRKGPRKNKIYNFKFSLAVVETRYSSTRGAFYGIE